MYIITRHVIQLNKKIILHTNINKAQVTRVNKESIINEGRCVTATEGSSCVEMCFLWIKCLED